MTILKSLMTLSLVVLGLDVLWNMRLRQGLEPLLNLTVLGQDLRVLPTLGLLNRDTGESGNLGQEMLQILRMMDLLWILTPLDLLTLLGRETRTLARARTDDFLGIASQVDGSVSALWRTGPRMVG